MFIRQLLLLSYEREFQTMLTFNYLLTSSPPTVFLALSLSCPPPLRSYVRTYTEDRTLLILFPTSFGQKLTDRKWNFQREEEEEGDFFLSVSFSVPGNTFSLQSNSLPSFFASLISTDGGGDII